MRPDSKARLVDVAEGLALLVAPALAMGLLFGFASGGDAFGVGAFLGLAVGAFLASARREYRAVVTEAGIERERRSRPTDERNPWVRLASVEYDRRYDSVLAVLALLVAAAAFAYAVVGDPEGLNAARVLLVGLGGVVVALFVVGAPRSGDDAD